MAAVSAGLGHGVPPPSFCYPGRRWTVTLHSKVHWQVNQGPPPPPHPGTCLVCVDFGLWSLYFQGHPQDPEVCVFITAVPIRGAYMRMKRVMIAGQGGGHQGSPCSLLQCRQDRTRGWGWLPGAHLGCGFFCVTVGKTILNTR